MPDPFRGRAKSYGQSLPGSLSLSEPWGRSVKAWTSPEGQHKLGNRNHATICALSSGSSCLSAQVSASSITCSLPRPSTT
eukprot:63714-Rhodomonas_salina.2